MLTPVIANVSWQQQGRLGSYKLGTRWLEYFFFFSSGLIIFLLVVLSFDDIQLGKFSRRTMKSSLQVNNTHSLENNLDAMINVNSTTNNSQLTQRERTKTVLLIYTVFFGTAEWIRDRDKCGFENKFLGSGH